MIFILFPIYVCALWIIVPTLFIVLSVNLTKHVKHINKNLEFNFISFFTWKTVNANGELSSCANFKTRFLNKIIQSIYGQMTRG